ncbi:MAG: hypothetical protein IKV27_07475 [Lachnospiraceae bacterium]|nr:hypothetical protein [Lachnospiraceae bacterium]
MNSASNPTDEKEITINLSDNGKKAPHKNLIIEDVKKELTEKYPHITMNEVQGLKSLTEDKSYQITLQVKGQSKYADWTLELDLFYTKYDQGWGKNKSTWNIESYNVVRIPEVDEMVEYATDYLLNHEEYSDTYFTDYMTPMINSSIQYDFDATADDFVLELCWEAKESSYYQDKLWHFTSLWVYNPAIDNWDLVPNPDPRSLGYYVDQEYKGKKLRDLDYSGERDLINFKGKKISTLKISNFSWSELDAYIPGYMKNTEHFVFTDHDTLKGEYDCAFVNNKGDYIAFIVQERTVYIYYYTNDDSVAANVTITENLPDLQ